jgi:NitT/TauT family transport system substrate-binding protein
MLVARSKGADDVALMSIYANTGQTFYWLKSYGVNGVKDFPGHKIGNPPGDASRVMWPAFAKAAGIAADSVNFVNVGPTAKIAALKSHTVDIISDFYNEHDLKAIEFGSDLGFVNWKDIGLNPYGNSLIVNGAYLAKNPKLVEDFVKVSQRAFAACVADVEPCLKALLDQVSGLDRENQQRQWKRIKFLMTDEFTTTKALGWIDAARMTKDYDLVQTYLGMEKPFDVQTAFTTGMLDTSVKMDASKVKK